MAAIRRQRPPRRGTRSGRQPTEEEIAARPAEVEALVRRLMAKHPDDRYATPADAARAIGAVLARIDDEATCDAGSGRDAADAVAGLRSLWQSIVEASGPQRIDASIVEADRGFAERAGRWSR